ncbi:MAG: hypothetical protein L0K08_07325 [Bifidobacterium mongoliense]|nr:hypothetical protein [Bifidobacterium mongoliense]
MFYVAFGTDIHHRAAQSLTPQSGHANRRSVHGFHDARVRIPRDAVTGKQRRLEGCDGDASTGDPIRVHRTLDAEVARAHRVGVQRAHESDIPRTSHGPVDIDIAHEIQYAAMRVTADAQASLPT